MNAQELIEKYAAAKAALAHVMAEKQQIANTLIPAEVHKALYDLDVEFEEAITDLSAQADSMREQAKDAVLSHGATVSVAGWSFKYSRGKSGGWDTKELEKLANSMRAAGNPTVADNILACRKPDGNPYVSVEEVKGK